jgi:hypothetical protein
MVEVATEQPAEKEYVIITEPEVTPVTNPVDGSMTAITVLSLLQTPPLTPSLRYIDDPAHTVVLPVIGVGVGSTDRVIDEEQPDNV